MSASLDLARRAVACKRWRWMPGMLDAARGRVVEVVDIEDMHDGRERQMALAVPARTGQHVGPPRAVRSYFIEQLDAPDLDDPATLGCLLALVREAWGEPVSAVRYWHGGFMWEVDVEDASKPFGGATEAEALVAALEAAP